MKTRREKREHLSQFLIGTELVSVRGGMAERSAEPARAIANLGQPQTLGFDRAVFATDERPGRDLALSVFACRIAPARSCRNTE